jgi:acyl-CoA synthetase (NDP forming)
MGQGKATVRAILDQLKDQGRTSLTAPECHQVCTAYGIPLPQEGLANAADDAARLADGIGYPVVMKIVSPDILHKTEAGGVVVGVASAAAARAAYQQIIDAAAKYDANARIEGVQVQQMLAGGAQEVIVGAVTDPSFGKLVAFGLGGILVEVLKDITFRLASASTEDALSMLDGIQAAEVLRGVRGADPVDRDALAAIIVAVSNLIADFPEIQEIDLNPIFATKDGATAVDALISVDFSPPKEIYRPSQEEILVAMNRIFHPRSVAVIGASAEDGKIGNSVMKNLINGGYAGAIYPVHPKAEEILGKKVFKSVLDIPGEVDLAGFAIAARVCAAAREEVGG